MKNFYIKEFKLGEIYTIYFKSGGIIMQAQFVQTTNRGFNFLNMKNHRMFFNKHFYCANFKEMKILPNIESYKVYVPTYMQII